LKPSDVDDSKAADANASIVERIADGMYYTVLYKGIYSYNR